jgi:hypothetical protein
MQNLLASARRYSSDIGGGGRQDFARSVSPLAAAARDDDDRHTMVFHPRTESPVQQSKSSVGSGGPMFPRRQSTHNNLLDDNAARRLSEAGVNRRPSAAQILTEDTDSFIVGMRVYVDGVNPGRIQYIGECKFGPGEWSGIVLDEPLGKNDGSVGKTRYFQCEQHFGVFSRLFRLTKEPVEGASSALDQMRKYGYELADAHNCPVGRRGSFGSGGGGSRRGSTSIPEEGRRGSMDRDRGSSSPRSGTPELRRMSRNSPESCCHGGRRLSAAVNVPSSSLGGDRRQSLNVPERRGSMGTSPMGRKGGGPGKSPLASPRASRCVFEVLFDLSKFANNHNVLL